MELIHAEDERIHVDSLDFGTTGMGRLLERIGQVAPDAGAGSPL